MRNMFFFPGGLAKLMSRAVEMDGRLNVHEHIGTVPGQPPQGLSPLTPRTKVVEAWHTHCHAALPDDGLAGGRVHVGGGSARRGVGKGRGRETQDAQRQGCLMQFN